VTVDQCLLVADQRLGLGRMVGWAFAACRLLELLCGVACVVLALAVAVVYVAMRVENGGRRDMFEAVELTAVTPCLSDYCRRAGWAADVGLEPVDWKDLRQNSVVNRAERLGCSRPGAARNASRRRG
jgi:hypothetical protein